MKDLLQLEIGSPVIYFKDGSASRDGWKGVVSWITRYHPGRPGSRDKIYVEWDGQTPQGYDPGSFTGQQFPGEGLASVSWTEARKAREPRGYIWDDKVPTIVDAHLPSYFVAGEQGGQPMRVQGIEAARSLAEKKATDSKSGQAYRIYEPVEAFRRTTPPVRHIVLSDEES